MDVCVARDFPENCNMEISLCFVPNVEKKAYICPCKMYAFLGL